MLGKNQEATMPAQASKPEAVTIASLAHDVAKRKSIVTLIWGTAQNGGLLCQSLMGRLWITYTAKPRLRCGSSLPNLLALRSPRRLPRNPDRTKSERPGFETDAFPAKYRECWLPQVRSAFIKKISHLPAPLELDTA
jgi:hypothetical protein